MSHSIGLLAILAFVISTYYMNEYDNKQLNDYAQIIQTKKVMSRDFYWCRFGALNTRNGVVLNGNTKAIPCENIKMSYTEYKDTYE